MRRHPMLADIQSLTMTLEHLDQCVISKRLSPPSALASNEKQVWALDINRAFLHNVGRYSLQSFRLVQVHDSLSSRLGADTLWVISTISNDNATVTVLHVLKMEAEDLTGA